MLRGPGTYAACRSCLCVPTVTIFCWWVAAHAREQTLAACSQQLAGLSLVAVAQVCPYSHVAPARGKGTRSWPVGLAGISRTQPHFPVRASTQGGKGAITLVVQLGCAADPSHCLFGSFRVCESRKEQQQKCHVFVTYLSGSHLAPEGNCNTQIRSQ